MKQTSMMALRRTLIFLFVVSLVTPAHAFDFPKDMPTIEALIDLHKRVKKDEDKAKERIISSHGIQSLVTEGTKKYNDVKSTLNTKLNNIHSYVILASHISVTANSLYRLIDEYSDFTSNTVRYVREKPFVAWYCANANLAIEREIRHCYKLYGIFAATGVNVWRASMDEKVKLIFTLKLTVDKCRAIIQRANLYCSLMVNGNWRPDYIWEILNSDVRNAIVEGVIEMWRRQ